MNTSARSVPENAGGDDLGIDVMLFRKDGEILCGQRKCHDAKSDQRQGDRRLHPGGEVAHAAPLPHAHGGDVQAVEGETYHGQRCAGEKDARVLSPGSSGEKNHGDDDA